MQAASRQLQWSRRLAFPNSSSAIHRAQKHGRWTTSKTSAQKPQPPPLPAPSSSSKPALPSFAIGALAGTLGSLAGMGGGFVMIPLMSSILRLNQHTAHGTSLFAVAATGLAGAMSYGDAVQWPQAAAVAATAMVTSRLGARTTLAMSEVALKRALGYLMLAMAPAVPAKAYLMKQQKQQEPTLHHGVDDRSNNTWPTYDWMKLLPAAAVGLVSGYLSGLFGVGGGVIVVPALTVSCPTLTHREALATSLAAMCLPALLGTFTHYRAGNCSVAVAPFLAVGALAGAYVGGQLSLRLPREEPLQWGFCALLTVLGTRTILKS